ncbi:MAG TPA: hypothetical protein VFG68_12095 [Fimbriiglobus sp.]|nr:hypothetical protein [Fimbriiglobus sp.]
MTPLRLIAAGVALAGLFATPGLAQPPANRRDRIPSIPEFGSEAFRGLLHLREVEPVDTADLRDTDYADLIVVVLGYPRPTLFNPAPHVQRALREGGAVLIAIDEPVQLSHYFPEPTNVEITGEQVTTGVKDLAYGGQTYCPFVVPRQPGPFDKDLLTLGSSETEWGLFLGIDRLATNVPGSIRVQKESRFVRSRLAGYPPALQLPGRARPGRTDDRQFAVAGSGGKDSPYRCLVLADPSVFSNQMLAPPPGWPPNQNVVFADRVVRWLRGPTNRSKCLFIENGVPQTAFDIVRYDAMQSLPPLPVPPIPDPLDPELQRKVTDAANRWIARVEDNDSLHKRLAGTDNRFYRVTRFLAAVAALVLLVLLIRRAWRKRHEPDVPPVPTDTGRVAGTGPPGSLARRREEILQAGDYGPVVREYLQEMFVAQGLPAAADPPHRLPEVRVKGRGGTTLREHLRILWDVAFGPRPRPVNYGRWKELEPMIDAVRRAAADGRWRFEETGDAA